ncbi:MAG: hypothetical protein K6T30_07810, partial [Alicyclobacillus sp.]|nr:hypothetical protein [Alicyclobacillus sp.]
MQGNRSTVGQAGSRPFIRVRVGNEEWYVGAAVDDGLSMDEEVAVSGSRALSAGELRARISFSSLRTLPQPQGWKVPRRQRRWRTWLSRVSGAIRAGLEHLLLPAWESAASEAPAVPLQTGASAGRWKEEGGLSSPSADLLRRSRLVRGSVQMGAVAGMFLGCLSLLWFHQIRPAYDPLPAPVSVAPAPVAAKAGVTVPAARLYALRTPAFPTRAAAAQAQASYSRRGIPAVADGQTGRTLLLSLAVYSAHLVDELHQLQHAGVQATVSPLRWNAPPVPISGLSPDQAGALTRWLAAQCSA